MKSAIKFFLLSFCFLLVLAGCSDDKNLSNSKKSEKLKENKYVTVGDYENLEVTVGKSTVTEENVKSYIERMLGSYVPDGQQKPSYDELTDEFVATKMTDTECKTVAELKRKVSDYLNDLNEYYAENNTRSAVIEKLSEICTVKKFPDGLLDKRVLLQEKIFKSNCEKQYGMEFSEYLTSYQITEKSFHEQTVANTKSEIESELILSAIAEFEEIKITDDEIKEYAQKMLENYGFNSIENLYADYGEDYVKSKCLCEKVLNVLSNQAKVKFVAPGNIPSK